MITLCRWRVGMVEEVLVVWNFEINVGIIFVVAHHHLIGWAGVVTAAGFLAAAATTGSWIITLLLDALVFGASILKPDFHLFNEEGQQENNWESLVRDPLRRLK